MVLLTQGNKTISCKYCGFTDVVKCGSYKGIQRYWCKVCKRKFKVDNHLFHMKVPAEYVSNTLNMYYSGMSINDIRYYLKNETNYYPPRSLIYQWVDKYTTRAINTFQEYHPQVGDTWLAWETTLKLGRQNIWISDIMDEKTYFILVSLVACKGDVYKAQRLLKEASKKAGKIPNLVGAAMRNPDVVEQTFGCEAKHIQIKPRVGYNYKREYVFSMLQERMRILHKLKTLETVRKTLEGWIVYHNFFKTNLSLGGKTPAEAAKIDYQIKSWTDFITKITRN